MDFAKNLQIQCRAKRNAVRYCTRESRHVKDVKQRSWQTDNKSVKETKAGGHCCQPPAVVFGPFKKLFTEMEKNAPDLENYKVSHSDGKPVSWWEFYWAKNEYNLILNI